MPRADGNSPAILCAGITVLDEVFQVTEFPKPDGKVQATGFFVVNGGCAANAAVAIARLGGRAFLAGPLGGPAGEDANGDRVLAALAHENVDCSGCLRVEGVATALSAILIDARGERMIVTYRDNRVAAARPSDPEGLVGKVDALLADNRYPDFVRPICEAGRRRGLPVVLDGDKPTDPADPLFRTATHVVFSSECLSTTTGIDDLDAALLRMREITDAFLAVTDGPRDVRWLEGKRVQRSPVFRVSALDTLGAGDAFHGAFTLALAEGRDIPYALRFAAATAGLKCSRLGGSAGAPRRGEVEALLAGARLPSPSVIAMRL